MKRILIVDDEQTARKGLYFILKSKIDSIDEAEDIDQAEQLLHENEYDLMITDLRLPTEEIGLKLVRSAREMANLTPVLVMTAFGSLDNAVSAMKAGAQDYVTKDFSREEILLKIEKLLETRQLWLANLRLSDQVVELKKQYPDQNGYSQIIGESEPIKHVLTLVSRVGEDNDSTVLITGESGTGKELVARAIHSNSPIRKINPFVVVDIANVPATLLESQLFGHEKGAFTNAYQQHTGLIERAEGGTIFLDEIGDFPLDLQIKLLRFLQEKTYSRVGGTLRLNADVRIVAATNKNLESLVESKKFREDLFYRLNVIRITLPTLEQRKDDIPALVRHFQNELEMKKNRKLHFSKAAISKLKTMFWPGNVRQLQNMIESLYVMSTSDVIEEADIETEKSEPAENQLDKTAEMLVDLPFKEARKIIVEQFEKRYLAHQLELFNGNISRIAERVDESREGLSRKIKRYGLK